MAVGLLAAWPMPSTAPDLDRAKVDVAALTATPERTEPRRAATRPPASRVPAPSSEPNALAAALAGADADPAPHWQLVDPEKSHVDWNVEMGELLTAYMGCPEVYPIDDEDDSPLAYALDGLRQMFEDEAFDPNSSVGSYQIASEATKSVRELLELEGCI